MARRTRRGWDTQVKAARKTLGHRHPYLTILWHERVAVLATVGVLAVTLGAVFYNREIGHGVIWAWHWLVGVGVPAILIGAGTTVYGIVAFMVWHLWGWDLRRLGLDVKTYTSFMVVVLLCFSLVLGFVL